MASRRSKPINEHKKPGPKSRFTLDQKKCIFVLHQQGVLTKDLAEQFRCSPTYVRNIVRFMKLGGK